MNKDKHENTGYSIFQKESPEVAQAFGSMIESLGASGGLDSKTMQLIYIGIRASQGQAGAVAAHVPMARQAGASKEEIRGVILLTLATCGVIGVTNCLAPALEAYDRG